MLGVAFNSEILGKAASLIGRVVGAQERSRKRLVKDLTGICSRCEDAYGAVISALQPVKRASKQPSQLAGAMRKLAADRVTRRQFKPERLCSEIDQLLIDLKSWLSSLRYAIDVSAVESTRRAFKSMGDYDAALKDQYESFMREIDSIATALLRPDLEDSTQLMALAIGQINRFETTLRSAVDEMRRIKSSILNAV